MRVPHTFRATALLCAGCLLCAACGSGRPGSAVTLEGSSGPSSGATGTAGPPTTTMAVRRQNLVDADYTGRFRTTGMVVERSGGGPQLCLGTIAATLPPGCGGARIVGWSWAEVGHESMSGVQYGEYDLVGRYDGTVFTLTEPARPRDLAAMPALTDPFVTPCPTPSGGWRPTDPARATDVTFKAAATVAKGRPGYALLWVDRIVPIDTSVSTTGNAGYDDPMTFILNVATSGDQASMTRAIRMVWGGAVCVSGAPRAAAELDAVAAKVSSSNDMLSTWTDGRGGFVEVDVILATTQRQEQLDARYGTGVVRLFGALQPLD